MLDLISAATTSSARLKCAPIALRVASPVAPTAGIGKGALMVGV